MVEAIIAFIRINRATSYKEVDDWLHSHKCIYEHHENCISLNVILGNIVRITFCTEEDKLAFCLTFPELLHELNSANRDR